MENEARYILVGSLIITVSLMLVASLIWLAGGERVAYQHYTIYFRNQSMDGLDISSPVKLRGIKVGEVSDFSFAAGGHGGVQVNIKVEPNTPIHIDSRATVQRNIVTGLAWIDISNPNPESPLRTNENKAPPWPVIAEGSSDFEKVTTSLTQMTAKAARALDNINLVLNSANRSAFAHTLNNLEILSKQLVTDKQDIDGTLRSVRNAADAMTSAADRIGHTSDQADHSIVLLTQQATHTLNSLQQQSVVLSQQMQQLADSAHLQLNQMSSDVHRSANALSDVGQRFNQPASLLFGSGRDEPAPGE